MNSNRSSTGMVVGLAAVALAVVVAGVRLFRQHRAGKPSGGRQGKMPGEASSGVEGHSHGEAMHDEGGIPRYLPPDAAQATATLRFFLLTLALSIPFYVFGGNKLPLPVNLPTGALVGFMPMVAAMILSFRQHGSGGIRQLLKGVLDYRKIRRPAWYLPTLFLMPLVYFLSYRTMRLAGLPLPDARIPVLLVPVYFILYFIEAVGEELGWMGYAIDPLQKRWGALKASLILAAGIAVWHTIPYIQTQNPPTWIVWQLLSEFPLRILYTWIYNNTGNSVFVAILFHVMVNISWSMFPNNGSHYDPFVTGVITWLAVVLVLFGWGGKSLAQFRFAPTNS